MNLKRNLIFKLALAGLGALCLLQDVQAQSFQYNQTDLLLGFRKTGGNQDNFELVVNLGSIATFSNLPPGTNITITNYSSSQLSSAFANFSNLNWSVCAASHPVVAGYPDRTIWLSLPRANVNVQTTPVTRASSGAQTQIGGNIQSALAGAQFLSGQIGGSNANNNAVLVREPINDPNNLSAFISGQFDTTISTWQDTLGFNVEVKTPASFTSPVRCDFYEIRPTGSVDPHSGSTNGNSYFLGFFELGTNGVMTFTRASVSSSLPKPTLSLTRTGTTNRISFGTTNGPTYTLFFTNTGGLSQSISNWPTGGTLTGNGSNNTFTNVTTDTNRFYSVGVH
jgi:hypothetical protein